MAFKLDKKELERKAGLVEALNEQAGKLDDALATYNAEAGLLWDKLQFEIEAYNEIVAEARGFAEDIANAATEEYDNKSEKWQEGERGQAASEWKDAWENNELDEIEVEKPEEITMDDPDHGAKLEQLPEEAETP